MFYFIKYTRTTASVIGIFKAFQTDCRYKVFYTQHFLAKFFIN